jgi:Arc/MetJ family transcription regulator
MRMTVKIDDKLMKAAMRAAKTKTKRATMGAALRLLADLSRQERIRELRGKVAWEGDLEESRTMRAFPPL